MLKQLGKVAVRRVGERGAKRAGAGAASSWRGWSPASAAGSRSRSPARPGTGRTPLPILFDEVVGTARRERLRDRARALAARQRRSAQPRAARRSASCGWPTAFGIAEGKSQSADARKLAAAEARSRPPLYVGFLRGHLRGDGRRAGDVIAKAGSTRSGSSLRSSGSRRRSLAGSADALVPAHATASSAGSTPS